jgi:hypothetical protein
MKKNKTGIVQQPVLTYLDTEPPEKSKPTGPFRTVAQDHKGDLLLFVPRNQISGAINELTGRYGYSHLAIDCGEIDVPSGRRVMIEVTMDAGVHYAFQDEYGKRPFARLPLSHAGVDVERFCECVHEKVGEKFDNVEAITLGIFDNPARQICSDLATVCLPEDIRALIKRYHRKAVIHPLAAVKDEKLDPGFRLFVSPNGFAEFFGIPRGSELEGPDQRVEPHIQADSNVEFLPRLWKWSDTLLTSTWRHLRQR